MKLSSVIRELLLTHEKALIPEFGAFIISHEPAALNKITGVLSPPSRGVQFNGLMKADDRHLTDYLIRKHQLNREEALKEISGFVGSINDQLSAEGTALIEGLGSLSSGSHGELTFQPLDELLSRINAVALPSLDIPAASSSARGIIHQVPAPPVDTPEVVRKRRWWIPAAIILLVGGIAALIYLTGLYKTLLPGTKTNHTASADSSEADRLVFGKRANAEADTVQDRISRELDKRTASREALQYKDAVNRPDESPENKTDEAGKASLISSEKPFHIIAGAFLVPNNAERQVKKLEQKGFSPVMLPRRGDYYMVSLGSFDTRGQAEDAMRQMKDEAGLELWILKK